MRIVGLLAVVGAVLCLGVVSERYQPGTTPRLVRIVDMHSQLSEVDRKKLEYLISPLIHFHRNHAYIPARFPVYIRIFPKNTDFIAYRRAFSKSSTSSAGTFLYQRNEVIINKALKGYRISIVHEAQHAIFHYVMKNPPRWLDEGLSEVCERFYLDGATIRGKVQRIKIQRIRDWIATYKSLPLRNLFLLSNMQWGYLTDEQKTVAYTLSYYVVYYFSSDASRRNLFLHIIRDHYNRRETSLAIIERRYPGGLAQLERDLQDYFR